MSDQKQRPCILMCALASISYTEPGADFSHFCSECTRRVQISPRGKPLINSISDVKIICDECYKPQRNDEMLVLSPPQNVVPNFWRNRN